MEDLKIPSPRPEPAAICGDEQKWNGEAKERESGNGEEGGKVGSKGK